MYLLKHGPKKICVVQFGRIGDLILMTPMFKAIYEANPQNLVHVLAGRNNFHFAQNYPYIDKVHIYKKIPWQTASFIRSLKDEHFDIWIDPKDHYSIESYYFAKFADAGFRVGFNPRKKRLFDRTIPLEKEQKDLHVLERNLKALALAGICSDIQRPILFSEPVYDKVFDAFLAEHNIHTFACFNLSANAPARYWPEEKWQALLKKSRQRIPHILLIGKPEDRVMASRLAASGNPFFYYATRSVSEVFSVVKRAKLLVSPDTAVIHMASAFNVPVIGLYANRERNIVKFHPLSDHYKVIINKASDTQIREIAVTEVMEAFDVLCKGLDR